MPFDKPGHYDDIREWFTWFRLTKHLPAMPKKFAQAMQEAPDAQAARTVMTAYAAASLDVAFFVPMHPPQGLAQDLEFLCGFQPSWMLRLSVKDMAGSMHMTAQELSSRLAEGGFRVDESGLVTGYEQPAPIPDAAPRPRRRGGVNMTPK